MPYSSIVQHTIVRLTSSSADKKCSFKFSWNADNTECSLFEECGSRMFTLRHYNTEAVRQQTTVGWGRNAPLQKEPPWHRGKPRLFMTKGSLFVEHQHGCVSGSAQNNLKRPFLSFLCLPVLFSEHKRNALVLYEDGKPQLVSDAEERTPWDTGECISTRTNQSEPGQGGKCCAQCPRPSHPERG